LQQQFLVTAPKSLALDAAATAIMEGMLETAVELLEQGRAILWSRMRGYRHSVEKLRGIDRGLAVEFETVSGQLERHVTSSVYESTTSPTSLGSPTFLEIKMQQQRILSERWDSVVSKIRQVDGFTNFLQAVPYVTLQNAAAEGPVIIVNISTIRSDAIILLSHSHPVLVPLPKASPQDLANLYRELSQVLNGKVSDRPKGAIKVLRALWDIVVLPVKEQLVRLEVAQRTRIWWCPTSDLCGLPLHAAGVLRR
jgi:hypothetical protein